MRLKNAAQNFCCCTSKAFKNMGMVIYPEFTTDNISNTPDRLVEKATILRY